MPDPLVERLQQFETLLPEDVQALEAMTERVITFPRRACILRADDALDGLYVMRKGWGSRCVTLPEGRRQIVSFVIPGDLCNSHLLLFPRMEHGIAALTPCEVGVISPERFLAVLESHPRVGRALYLSGLVMESALRERIVTIGRRTATQRIAHLVCELLLRLRAAGLARDHGFDLPLTQLDIADTLGLNHVHVNRVLKTMRKTGLIRLKGHVLEIPNWDGLTALGEFDPHYFDGFVRRGGKTAPAPESRPRTSA